jgi:hypothetical protein
MQGTENLRGRHSDKGAVAHVFKIIVKVIVVVPKIILTNALGLLWINTLLLLPFGMNELRQNVWHLGNRQLFDRTNTCHFSVLCEAVIPPIYVLTQAHLAPDYEVAVWACKWHCRG